MSNETKAITEATSYVSFKLNDEQFAVDVTKAIEVLDVPHITKIPNTPAYMAGVINLRGSILPLIDTRVKFGLSPTEFTIDTSVVVLEIESDGEKILIGALVDAVLEVFEISENEILPSPSIETDYDLDFISGMFSTDKGFVMLLNMDAVFSVGQIELLNKSSEIISQANAIIEEGSLRNGGDN